MSVNVPREKNGGTATYTVLVRVMTLTTVAATSVTCPTKGSAFQFSASVA